MATLKYHRRPWCPQHVTALGDVVLLHCPPVPFRVQELLEVPDIESNQPSDVQVWHASLRYHPSMSRRPDGQQQSGSLVINQVDVDGRLHAISLPGSGTEPVSK